MVTECQQAIIWCTTIVIVYNYHRDIDHFILEIKLNGNLVE